MTLRELRAAINEDRQTITAEEIEDLFAELDSAGWKVLERQFEGGRTKIVETFCETIDEYREKNQT